MAQRRLQEVDHQKMCKRKITQVQHGAMMEGTGGAMRPVKTWGPSPHMR